MSEKDIYNWKGNNLVYSERHGWHLRPTANRSSNTMKEHTDYLKKTKELREEQPNITQNNTKSSEKA